jgi:hypothetical protein
MFVDGAMRETRFNLEFLSSFPSQGKTLCMVSHVKP